MSNNSAEWVSHGFLEMLMHSLSGFQSPLSSLGSGQTIVWFSVDQSWQPIESQETSLMSCTQDHVVTCLLRKYFVYNLLISPNLVSFYQHFLSTFFFNLPYSLSLLINRWTSYEIACQIYQKQVFLNYLVNAQSMSCSPNKKGERGQSKEESATGLCQVTLCPACLI